MHWQEIQCQHEFQREKKTLFYLKTSSLHVYNVYLHQFCIFQLTSYKQEMEFFPFSDLFNKNAFDS